MNPAKIQWNILPTLVKIVMDFMSMGSFRSTHRASHVEYEKAIRTMMTHKILSHWINQAPNPMSKHRRKEMVDLCCVSFVMSAMIVADAKRLSPN